MLAKPTSLRFHIRPGEFTELDGSGLHALKMLIIFDIDGTLTATNGFDARCSAGAFEEVFGFSLPTTDWRRYRTSTDTGIIAEAVESIRGEPVSPGELDRFESTFLRKLSDEHARDAGCIFEIPGALTLLRSLNESSGYSFGIATGGMKTTSLFKLASAGFDVTDRPAAFANDAVERADIIRHVLLQAGATPDEAIYVGDASWDVRAAASLGMRFVGITSDSSETRLREAGASTWLPDYSDPNAFFDAITRVQPLGR